MRNYMIHHVLIALAIQSVLIHLTDNVGFATVIPIIFYTGREIWQYYYLRIGKKFDWDGCIPVWVAMWLVFLGHL